MKKWLTWSLPIHFFVKAYSRRRPPPPASKKKKRKSKVTITIGIGLSRCDPGCTELVSYNLPTRVLCDIECQSAANHTHPHFSRLSRTYIDSSIYPKQSESVDLPMMDSLGTTFGSDPDTRYVTENLQEPPLYLCSIPRYIRLGNFLATVGSGEVPSDRLWPCGTRPSQDLVRTASHEGKWLSLPQRRLLPCPRARHGLGRPVSISTIFGCNGRECVRSMARECGEPGRGPLEYRWRPGSCGRYALLPGTTIGCHSPWSEAGWDGTSTKGNMMDQRGTHCYLPTK